MTNTNCLNCDKELEDKFCSRCGQKSDTHRISFKNFVLHDVLHGTFHLEKGILFTAREALIHPGKAALNYISGKRKRYYNVFYLILITVGLIIFFRHFYGELIIGQGRNYIENPQQLNEASQKIDSIFSQKSKIIIFLFVPFGALNSYLLFKRKKLNLSEHSIISGMILLGILLLSLFGTLIFYLDLLFEFNDFYSSGITIVIISLIILYVGYGYFDAFASEYTDVEFLGRILLFYGLATLELILLIVILVGFATNWQFSEVTITPFG